MTGRSPMPEVPLTGSSIRGLLAEVAAELPAGGPRHEIVVVGGSALAMHELRATTLDVDSVTRLDDELVRAAAEVARRHDLDARWLNDRAAMFLPASFDSTTCEVIADWSQLRVLAPPLSVLFVMKLYASRASDFDDLVRIWPHAGYETPAAACLAFEKAYPHLEPDPYLESHVALIAEHSGRAR